MCPIVERLQAVQDQIRRFAAAASRPADAVRLLAVSKTFGPPDVIAAADAGQRAFGESYLQEALDKQASIASLRPDLQLEWHFIGPIQSNKTRAIAASFEWVHAVDRLKIAQRLSEQRPPDLPPLQVCLQVNISGEASKNGVTPQELPALAAAVMGLPNLRLRGLMAIPEPATDFERQRLPFARLRELAESLRAQGMAIDALSMGMSADLQAAIAEGATIVRVGTAIFGQRETKN
jgi:pyridoxal phosphate enzyme (YggS family)